MRTSQPSSLAVLRRKCLSWVGHIARNQKGCPILKSVHELKKKTIGTDGQLQPLTSQLFVDFY